MISIFAMEDQEVPTWIITTLEEQAISCGVTEPWHIYIKMTDTPNGDSDNMASVFVELPEYLNARLEVNTKIQEGLVGKQYLRHELIHIGMAEIDQVFYRLLGKASGLPQGLRDELSHRYYSAVEAFIQKIAREGGRL